MKQAFNTLQNYQEKTHRSDNRCINFTFKKKVDVSFYQNTLVTIQKLKESEIEYYVNNFKVLDKAGSYGIQGYFAIHIKKIKGVILILWDSISLFYSYYKSIQKKLY